MTETRKRQCAGILCLLADRARGQADVTVWRFDSSCQKLYAGRPRCSDDLLRLVEQLVEAETGTKDGTYPALPLRRFSHELASSCGGRPAIGLVLTDGEDWDPEATRTAVDELVRSELQLLLVGPVLPEFGEEVEASMEPLGKRAVVKSTEDLQFGVEQLLDELAKALTQQEVAKSGADAAS